MLKGHHLRASSVALLCGTAMAVASCGTTNNSPANSPAVNSSPASPSSANSGYALEPNAVVIRVIDGDTIEADIGGNRQLARFIDIDTPEKTGSYLPAECFGDIASTRTRELIPAGTPLHLKRDTELHDRYLNVTRTALRRQPRRLPLRPPAAFILVHRGTYPVVA